MADVRLTQLFTNIANAIRNKKGSVGIIKAADFPAEIESIEVGGSAPRWTGHADVEGLKAIGWDDADIAYYQQYGVDWNEEEDEYHKVSDDNKALYGVLTANNIQTYRDRVVYLPKIDTSAVTNFTSMFNRCVNMVAIPMIDTSNAQSFMELFNRCYSLSCVPILDASKVTNATDMFYNCYALQYVPEIYMQQVVATRLFQSCYSLMENRIKLTAPNNVSQLYHSCYALKRVVYPSDWGNVSSSSSEFALCYNLEWLKIKKLNKSIDLSTSHAFKKESLLYIIENEAAANSISIKLETSAYTRLSADADIQAALAAHPNISLAK